MYLKPSFTATRVTKFAAAIYHPLSWPIITVQISKFSNRGKGHQGSPDSPNRTISFNSRPFTTHVLLTTYDILIT